MPVVASSRLSRLSPSTNRAAARIGPTVWELEGPMPILNRSNTLKDMSCSPVSCYRSSGKLQAKSCKKEPFGF
ncbi:hypothetical protein PFLmoz3_04925 [Pseudomonas fluorescens]|uniref:Uncharacterized protein n=1 Tax=Pseudomonas fluorescens TaxID=294 RepID=A0A109LD80_PSEFL|nr:hypothetical protein PFLmoz3_04925 [Pseudomonas fluorescens]